MANMLLDIQEMGLNDMNWINLAQDRDHWHAVGSIKCKDVCVCLCGMCVVCVFITNLCLCICTCMLVDSLNTAQITCHVSTTC